MIILFAYLLGSIPTGLIIGRVVAGKDIRLWGSGNIGASNVGRTIGRKWGLLTFIGDFLKGLIPVLIARYFLGLEMFFICLVGVVAVLGHIFSVFLRFKGGKGVATAGGRSSQSHQSLCSSP
ncbi:MAG: hypothetical protein Kow0090_14250 [Myxococcota bacterium]